MAPEAQRAAIAKACGWRNHTEAEIDEQWPNEDTRGNYFRDCYVMIAPGKTSKESWLEWPPDYLNDLNAMHEAEKVLDDSEIEHYWNHLTNTVFVHNGKRRTWVFEATATQRAEAFLRTLGLWKE